MGTKTKQLLRQTQRSQTRPLLSPLLHSPLPTVLVCSPDLEHLLRLIPFGTCLMDLFPIGQMTLCPIGQLTHGPSPNGQSFRIIVGSRHGMKQIVLSKSSIPVIMPGILTSAQVNRYASGESSLLILMMWVFSNGQPTLTTGSRSTTSITITHHGCPLSLISNIGEVAQKHKKKCAKLTLHNHTNPCQITQAETSNTRTSTQTLLQWTFTTRYLHR